MTVPVLSVFQVIDLKCRSVQHALDRNHFTPKGL